MKVEKISLEETGYFSNSFLEYVAASEKLTPFYTATPTIEHFDQVIKNRSFSKNKREKLVEVLKTQYRELSCSGLLNDNIESLLSDKTFTITTGHQLNIFTGPLYFIYKIVTVINAAKELKKKYPDYHFVPVYWMATEDHDFEEISYFWLHGKKHQWKTEQTGAVGHFDPSELKEILDKLPGDITIFKKAYLENKTLTDACR
ncbi:MAG: bacillithiol biosynthesis BshC, partial [Cyclobacteriaceae bacterium]